VAPTHLTSRKADCKPHHLLMRFRVQDASFPTGCNDCRLPAEPIQFLDRPIGTLAVRSIELLDLRRGCRWACRTTLARP